MNNAVLLSKIREFYSWPMRCCIANVEFTLFQQGRNS